MKEELEDMLIRYGVHGMYLGREYFSRAVIHAARQPELLEKIQNGIYKPIASDAQKDIRAIEKDLRTVRDVFMRNGGAELLVQMGGGEYWRRIHPSVGELIGIFAYHFRKKSGNTKRT